MIQRIRHRGLKKLYERDNASGVRREHARRVRLILTALEAAGQPADMNLPGWGLHPLKGDRKGEWAVKVDRMWRVTFKLEAGHATDVGYEDYHD